MRITNKHNLPELVVRAIENDPYDNGGADITVTQLVKPPRMVALEKLHAADLEADAADMLWALFGQSIHSVLERASDDERFILERRFTIERRGWTISGQVDVIDTQSGALQDYKVTSVWSIMNAFKDGKSEWEEQLNLLAYLARLNGIEINKVQIVAIARDWNRSQARYNADYPSVPVQAITFPLWTPEQQESFLERRLIEHQEAQQAIDEAEISGNPPQLPYCTSEEMWEKPAMYAVKTPGRKSAHRVLYTMEDAVQWAEENLNHKKYTIERRPPVRRRCEEYCRVRDFCDAWDAWKRDMEIERRV